MSDDLERAVAALRNGELVVYPTETVYGLGADALDSAAVERTFDVKRRSREKPISLAVPDVDAALSYVRPTPREERFMREFLPGPVTVLCEKRAVVPDVLTAGKERVGVRVPDHPIALALLRRTAPITSTSANVSGRGSAHRVADLGVEVRDAVSVVLRDEAERDPTVRRAGSEEGEAETAASTVVNVERGEILRRGDTADAVEAWLAEQ